MKLNTNYIISRILIGVGIIFLLTLLGIRDVKAETIPQPNYYSVYKPNGNVNTYSIRLMPQWWWGYNQYVGAASDASLIITPEVKQEFVWSNFRQYCSDTLIINGSITSVNFSANNDKFDIYINNGSKSNICSKNIDVIAHLVNFSCPITMSSINSVSVSINSTVPVVQFDGGFGLLTNSTYSCTINSSDIINNQNNNTQTIINNNNNNTNQIINNQNQNADKINDSINDVNDSITDSNVDSSSTSNFFNNFQDNDHGLSGIVSSPLRLVKAFTSNTCNPAKFTIFDKDVELPCSSILTSRQDFKPFYNVYNIIMGGLISYGCLTGIRKKVDDFKNPDDSKVEVMDL